MMRISARTPTSRLTAEQLRLLLAADKSEPGLRIVSILEDFDKLAGDVLLDDRQISAVSGYSVATLKSWRRRGGSGPRYVTVNGRPRSPVKFVREWLASLQRTS